MKIPDKVNVCGVIYTVEESETVDNDLTCLGVCIYADSKICLKKNISAERKAQTFVHELLHAIFYEAGFDEQDEELINRVGKVMYQVLQDNFYNNRDREDITYFDKTIKEV